MTTDDLRDVPGFQEAFSKAWPSLRAFLTARLVKSAAAAKCVIETAQAETARQKELALLLSELATVAMPVSPQTTSPKMPALHSMTETPDT